MTKHSVRPLIFGEVLFDRFPDGNSVLGGAPFNVAWHLQAFGLAPLVVSRIGNDDLGNSVQAAMEEWGMDLSGLQIDDLNPTGTVKVSFESGEPSYEIVDRVAWDFIDSSCLPETGGDWLIYHGLLAIRHETSKAALESLKQNISNKLFVDVNLRYPWYEKNTSISLIRGADWVKLNEEELDILFPDEEGPEEQLQILRPMIREAILLTKGKRGAVLFSAKDGSSQSIIPERQELTVDTVGAGDAFASVIIAGRLLGWPVKKTLERAQQFAAATVGIRGATTRDKSFYANFAAAWNLDSF